MTILPFPNPAVVHQLALRTTEADTGEHYVTIEPVPVDEPTHYTSIWDTPPRLCITEHRPGSPVICHGTEGWVPLADMPARAMAVAERLGALYCSPTSPIALDLLREVAS